MWLWVKMRILGESAGFKPVRSLRGRFPFEFGRQPGASPTRKRVRFIITDVANRVARIDGREAVQGVLEPFSVFAVPVFWRLPIARTFLPNRRIARAKRFHIRHLR